MSQTPLLIQAGPLTDDLLHTAMIRPLRHGVRLHAVIDACQSCPSLNLRCTARARKDGWSEWQVHKTIVSNACFQFTAMCMQSLSWLALALCYVASEVCVAFNCKQKQCRADAKYCKHRSVWEHLPSCLCVNQVVTAVVCDLRMVPMVINGSGKFSCPQRFCSKVEWLQS